MSFVRAPIQRTAMKPSRPKPFPTEVRELLRARSGGWCEAKLHGCQGEATDVCHRLGRKAGGRPNGDLDRLSNVWDGCRACHRWTHDRPAESYDMGLMLREGQTPWLEPMHYRQERIVCLWDDGTVEVVA